MKLEDKMELYDYFIHYNPYQKFWFAFKRGLEAKYMNGELAESEIMKSKNINDLVKYISFTKKGFKKAKSLNET